MNSEATKWAAACHLAALVAFLGIPFANILGPLVVWILKKDMDPFIEAQGKEAINFQASMTIYGICAALLCFVLIGFLVLPILCIAWLILTIMAGIKASNGEEYRYPLTIRFF